MSAARKPGKAAGSGRGDSFSGGGAKGKDEVILVEEELWTLQLGARNPPCNVAKFEEVWVGKGEAQRKVCRD